MKLLVTLIIGITANPKSRLQGSKGRMDTKVLQTTQTIKRMITIQIHTLTMRVKKMGNEAHSTIFHHIGCFTRKVSVLDK
ncbi:hypothetical protein VEJY3_05870 [Vibrio sp. EJY3]|nr:hypothetical protein VEJY3_05870 [Vibrio sp. EJY3]